MPDLPPKPAKPRLEKDIQDEIRSALSGHPGVTLFRNNSGRVWISLAELVGIGIPPPIAQRVVEYCRKKFGNLRFGLGEGSADLIGSVLVPVRLESDPSRVIHIARALAIEVKRPGEKQSDDQVKWMSYVTSKGWLGEVCTSKEEAAKLVGV